MRTGELEEIAEIGIAALRQTKVMHDELGKDGLAPMSSPNPLNEQALKADVLCEKAIFHTLDLGGLQIRARSEEHGVVDISNSPSHTAIVDGLDGTMIYKSKRGIGRYGSMLGIATGLDPNYDDYVFSGVMEHSSNRLWVAIRGRGSFLILPDGSKHPIHAANKKIVDSNTKIYFMSPGYSETARRYYSNVEVTRHTTLIGAEPLQDSISAAISYVDIASGEKDIEGDVTRKLNLEQMISYGLIREAGGVMVDINGDDIGPRKYLEFGQATSVPLITACTAELAADFLRQLNL